MSGVTELGKRLWKKNGRKNEGERGHGKGKIKEKVVKWCVLVLSWCLPAGLDTIPQLCLSQPDSHSHSHTHTEYLQSPTSWPPNEPSVETPHRLRTIPILSRPPINIHTLTHPHKTWTGKDATEAAHTTNSNITLPACLQPLNLLVTCN